MSEPAIDILTFDDLDDVPADVELCQNERCTEEGLHAAHTVSRRGATAKTYTCKVCQATVRLGLSCPCRKDLPT